MTPVAEAASTETDPFDPEAEGSYPDGEIGRLLRMADIKNADADDLAEDDSQAAALLREEAEDYLKKARVLESEQTSIPVPGEDPEMPADPIEIVVRGIELEYADLGGKRPEGAEIRLTGLGAIKLVEGTGFPKGTRIRFSGEAVVNDSGQKDFHDPTTQQVTSAVQRYGARVTDIRVEPVE
jgi:hypothetical protein